jgi:hypothetical protein
MREWERIATAPIDEDIEVGTAGRTGVEALALLCRRSNSGWTIAATGEPIHIAPRYWRRPAPFILGFDRRAENTAPLSGPGSAPTDKSC